MVQCTIMTRQATCAEVFRDNHIHMAFGFMDFTIILAKLWFSFGEFILLYKQLGIWMLNEWLPHCYSIVYEWMPCNSSTNGRIDLGISCTPTLFERKIRRWNSQTSLLWRAHKRLINVNLFLSSWKTWKW